MWRALVFIIAATLTACSSGSSDFGLAAMQNAENQTHHYRPIHPSHPEWVIAKLGKSLTLKGADERTKISLRPDDAIVRRAGSIAGRIVTAPDGIISFVPQDDAITDENVRLRCHRKRAEVFANSTLYVFRPNQHGVASDQFEIRKLLQKNKYSVTERALHGETCEGLPLESPFNSLGLAIFLTDELPLHQRMGIATFVTNRNITCL